MSEQNPYWAASQKLWRQFRKGVITAEQYKARSIALREEWEGDQQAIPHQANQTTDVVTLLAEARGHLLPREEVITRLGAVLQRNLQLVTHRERRPRYTAYIDLARAGDGSHRHRDLLPSAKREAA